MQCLFMVILHCIDTSYKYMKIKGKLSLFKNHNDIMIYFMQYSMVRKRKGEK
jgi:hypothetical protein